VEELHEALATRVDHELMYLEQLHDRGAAFASAWAAPAVRT